MMWILVELALLLAAIGIFVVALEVGYRLGVRRQVKTDEPDKTHANTLHGAVLGLLALLLGFTFAMAVSRYENRKTLMIEQANAIGTAALRGQLLPQPYADRTAVLFRDYVESRLQYNAAGSDDAKVNAAEARAGKIEEELWDIARTLRPKIRARSPRACSRRR